MKTFTESIMDNEEELDQNDPFLVEHHMLECVIKGTRHGITLGEIDECRKYIADDLLKLGLIKDKHNHDITI